MPFSTPVLPKPARSLPHLTTGKERKEKKCLLPSTEDPTWPSIVTFPGKEGSLVPGAADPSCIIACPEMVTRDRESYASLRSWKQEAGPEALPLLGEALCPAQHLLSVFISTLAYPDTGWQWVEDWIGRASQPRSLLCSSRNRSSGRDFTGDLVPGLRSEQGRPVSS